MLCELQVLVVSLTLFIAFASASGNADRHVSPANSKLFEGRASLSPSTEHDALSANSTSSVVMSWPSTAYELSTSVSFQVVVNPLLSRSVSPVHDEVFDAIAGLGAEMVRYAVWYPYPKYAVPELDEPSGAIQCGNVGEQATIHLSCAESGGIISSIPFASYGTASGFCGAMSLGSCNAMNSTAVVSSLCLNKTECFVPADVSLFGDPCYGTVKRLLIEATCSPSQQNTYWNFSLIDPMMNDFMAAQGSRKSVINFCTQPVWLYKLDSPHIYPDDPNLEDWSYPQGSQLIDSTYTQFGDYYGRLVSWYTNGGFIDEYGYKHISNWNYDIAAWEVLNEVDFEHQTSAEEYTALYDAVVQGIWRHTGDRTKNMKFIGLALGGHYDYHRYEYFLNASNHADNIPLDYISFHFYASCNDRSVVSEYETFFSQVDKFFDEVRIIRTIRDSLSPNTKIYLDETGVILPNDNAAGAEQFPNVYWNAAAALFAYEFGKLAVQNIDILGMSQLVGYPQIPSLDGVLQPQYPSVAMLNWTDGSGTARYWTLKLILDWIQVGDVAVPTVINASNPFCAFQTQDTVVELSCISGVMSAVRFASYGTPTGVCGSFQRSACDAANFSSIVDSICVGRSFCSFGADTAMFGDPCEGTFKYVAVEVECSDGVGSSGIADAVYAQGFVESSAPIQRKVLLVNKKASEQTIVLPNEHVAGSVMYVVDEASGFGPARQVALKSEEVTLNPFAVAILLLNDSVDDCCPWQM